MRLIHELLGSGSDGLVVAGTTGEGADARPTRRSCGSGELAVDESGAAPVIAGTGTNDTRHCVELTERAAEIGVDAVLVVTPYYNKPNRRGLKAHFEAVAAATELPLILYNIPSRCVVDMPNDLLAELAQIENVTAVKQARYEDLAPIEGLDLLAGNDDVLAKVLDMGGTGGIHVASHLVGREMRRMIDEPENRAEIQRVPRAPLRGPGRYHQPDPHQGCTEHGRTRCRRAAAPAGRGLGGRERRDPHRPRAARAARAGLSGDGSLRVLPLGGLGEIGKNMTVIEFDGRIVVVDTGLMFPRPTSSGSTSCCPTSPTCATGPTTSTPSCSPTGTRITWGRSRSCCGSWTARRPIYGGPLTAAMVRSKLDEHRLKGRVGGGRARGRDLRRRAVLGGDGEDGPLDPRHVRRRPSPASSARCWSTGDYKFDQTPVDGVPGGRGAAGGAGPRGPAPPLRRLHQRRPAGMSPSESSVGPRLHEAFARCEGRIVVTCFASNIHRVQQVVDAAAELGRKVALVGRSMRKNVNIGRMLGHIDVPEGLLVGPSEIEDFPDDKVVVLVDREPGRAAVGAAPHGARRPPPRGPARGRHRDLLRHPHAGQRAGGERDDRPHLPARRHGDHAARRA